MRLLERLISRSRGTTVARSGQGISPQDVRSISVLHMETSYAVGPTRTPSSNGRVDISEKMLPLPPVLMPIASQKGDRFAGAMNSMGSAVPAGLS